MKKVVVFLVVMLASLNLNAQSVQTLEVSEDGKYRINDGKNWQKTGITVDSAASKYLEIFPEVISKPNKPVLVYNSKKIKLKLFFRKLVEVNRKEILYDNNRIVYRLTSERKEEASYLVLFGIIPVILIILL